MCNVASFVGVKIFGFYRTKQNLVLNMHANHNRKGFLYTLHDYKISIPGKCRDDCAMQK